MMQVRNCKPLSECGLEDVHKMQEKISTSDICGCAEKVLFRRLLFHRRSDTIYELVSALTAGGCMPVPRMDMFRRRGDRPAISGNQRSSAVRRGLPLRAAQHRCTPAFTRRRHRGCGRKLPLWSGLLQIGKPVPLLHHDSEGRHEPSTRRQAARKPAPGHPVRPKIWRCI